MTSVFSSDNIAEHWRLIPLAFAAAWAVVAMFWLSSPNPHESKRERTMRPVLFAVFAAMLCKASINIDKEVAALTDERGLIAATMDDPAPQRETPHTEGSAR